MDAGLSQDAVAKAMAAAGFSSWRQTTVAKTEAADRPLLFVEADALARILNGQISDFMSKPRPLEFLIGDLRARVEGAQKHQQDVEDSLRASRCLVSQLQKQLSVALALQEFGNSGDSGVLRESLDALFERFGASVLTADRAYEEYGLPQASIREIDEKAVLECARSHHVGLLDLDREDLESQGGEYLINLSRVLDHLPADPRFLDYLRGTREWCSLASEMLTNLIVESASGGRNGI